MVESHSLMVILDISEPQAVPDIVVGIDPKVEMTRRQKV